MATFVFAHGSVSRVVSRVDKTSLPLASGQGMAVSLQSAGFPSS